MTKKYFVTGANGFLAMHLISQLLAAGDAVRGSVRSLAKGEAVKQALAAKHVPNLDQLEFVELDLTKDAGWQQALARIDGIFSVAAPVFVGGGSEEMAQVAAKGTLRVLKAAKEAKVPQVVMTGNLGAVGFSHFDQQTPVTEKDWTDPDQKGLSLYERSKLIAEQKAWEFVKTSPVKLSVVNAGAMLGPSVDGHLSGSFGLVKNLIGGMKRIPAMPVNVVDVRDVARLHVLAMKNKKALGQRFLAVADKPLTLVQMADVIRQKHPELADQLPSGQIPAWLLKALAPFNASAGEAKLFFTINHHVSTEKAQHLLGWQPKYTAETAVLEAAAAILKDKAKN